MEVGPQTSECINSNGDVALVLDKINGKQLGLAT